LRRTSHRIAIAAALASLASLGFAGTAAAEVDCGQTITQDTTLTHDVGPCPGDGITVTASNVTLNLNGRTITGGNLATGTAGVKFANVTGSTVTNGTIRAFNAGAVIDGGSSSNTYGSGNTVDNVKVDLALGTILGDFGEGIQITNSDGNTVKNSTVSLSGPYSGITLLGDSDYNKIGVAGGANTVENNIEPSGTSNQDDGIRLEPNYDTTVCTYPDHNKIENNTVSGNALDGIVVFAAPCGLSVDTAHVITNNRVKDNGAHTFAHRKGDGIRVFPRSNGNTIGGATAEEGNTVTGNAASGIRVDSENNTIRRNTATGNCWFPDPQRPCADLFDSSANCDNNSWTENTYGTRNQSCIS
jgi:parallel beta-helix repeat protein